MKAAYLAYDQTALHSLKSLSNYFKHIDYYFVSPESKSSLVEFEKLSLVTDTYSIGFDSSLQTLAQKKVLESLKHDYKYFKNELSPSIKNSLTPKAEIQNTATFDAFKITTINDLVFNQKSTDLLIEQDKVGLKDYKYLFIEDHQAVTESFGAFSKKIFKESPQNSHVWFSIQFEYELKKPRKNFLETRQFIFVQNRRIQTLLDNWMVCRFDQNTFSVEQWVPFNQFKNSDFQKFIIDRTEKIVREKFLLIHLIKKNECKATTAPGFCIKEAQLKNKKNSSMVPGFYFFSEDKINQYIQGQHGSKLLHLNQTSFSDLKGNR